MVFIEFIVDTRRMATRRLEERTENDEIPPQVEKLLQGAQRAQGGGNDVLVVPPRMTYREITEDLPTLARSSTTHVNMGIEPIVNVVEITMTSRL